MEILKSLFLFVSLSIVLALASCSNESTNPNNQFSMSSYFPTTQGSWWKYENWILDSTGARVKKHCEDSVVIEGTAFIGGKQAIIMADYSRDTNGISRKDTSYIAIEGSKLLAFVNLIFSDGDSIPWLTMADLNSANWLIYEKSIRDSNTQVSSLYYSMMSGSCGSLLDFSLKGETIKAQEFIINSVSKSSIMTAIDTTQTDLEGAQQDLYGKGIGQVYSKYMMTKNSGYPLQGFETILVDFEIK